MEQPSNRHPPTARITAVPGDQKTSQPSDSEIEEHSFLTPSCLFYRIKAYVKPLPHTPPTRPASSVTTYNHPRFKNIAYFSCTISSPKRLTDNRPSTLPLFTLQPRDHIIPYLLPSRECAHAAATVSSVPARGTDDIVGVGENNKGRE